MFTSRYAITVSGFNLEPLRSFPFIHETKESAQLTFTGLVTLAMARNIVCTIVLTEVTTSKILATFEAR